MHTGALVTADTDANSSHAAGASLTELLGSEEPQRAGAVAGLGSPVFRPSVPSVRVGPAFNSNALAATRAKPIRPQPPSSAVIRVGLPPAGVTAAFFTLLVLPRASPAQTICLRRSLVAFSRPSFS